MSCHHHHHHHHHNHHHQSQSPPCCCSNTCICCSSSNSNCNCCCSNSTPNPTSSTSDLLLQTLLLIQSQPQPPPRPIFLKPHPNKNPRHPLRSQPKPKQHDDDDDDAGPSLHLLHSLIRRVAALESSLSKISPPPPPPQKQQPQPQPQQRGQSSLKHAAAATIQRCFRRFLARRSRTLRHLNHLANIKSQAAALTSSLSDHAQNNPKALSRRAMHLLSHLHSIQSSDPMIREGKRSVSKELVRISEFVDKVLLIREKEDGVEELERSIDRARRVSFTATEDNSVGNVFDDLLERNPEAEDEEEEEEEEEVQGANESLKVVRHDKFTNGGFRITNGGLGLAAPLPLKMEPRRSASLK